MLVHVHLLLGELDHDVAIMDRAVGARGLAGFVDLRDQDRQVPQLRGVLFRQAHGRRDGGVTARDLPPDLERLDRVVYDHARAKAQDLGETPIERGRIRFVSDDREVTRRANALDRFAHLPRGHFRGKKERPRARLGARDRIGDRARPGAFSRARLPVEDHRRAQDHAAAERLVPCLRSCGERPGARARDVAGVDRKRHGRGRRRRRRRGEGQERRERAARRAAFERVVRVRAAVCAAVHRLRVGRGCSCSMASSSSHSRLTSIRKRSAQERPP